MRSDGKNKLVKKTYNTEDISNVVVDTFYKYWRTCAEIASQIRGSTEYQTCKNIWQFVIDNTKYVEDAPNTQFIRTPARLLDDGEGDCKSMAVLCASLATCCGIDCIFRFVGFAGNSNVSHVYVVTASGINIDPVEYFQQQRGFNQITPYKFKMDKPIKKGLAVLSGINPAIGATRQPYEVWLGGTNILDNTFATNYLYTAIDLQFSLIDLNEDDTDALNTLDRLICALLLYNQAKGNDAQLIRAGMVLQALYNDGWFDCYLTSDEERTEHLNAVAKAAEDYYNSNSVFDATGSVYDWFANKVIAADYINDEKTISGVKAAIGALSTSAGTNANANSYLNDIKTSGSYFLYDELESSQVNKFARRMPELKRRRAIQDSVRRSWIYGFQSLNLNKDSINNAIRSGQVKDLKKKNATEWFNDLDAEFKESRIGEPFTIITAICTIIAVLISLLSTIFEFVLGNKALEMQAADNSRANNLIAAANDYPEGAADETDFDGLAGNSSSDLSQIISDNKGLLTAAAVTLIVMKNKKNKK